MKNLKKQKGITLVALVVTIVVIIIIAVIAIRIINGEGIIGHAEESRSQYQAGEENENTTLGEYGDYMTEQINLAQGTTENTEPTEMTMTEAVTKSNSGRALNSTSIVSVTDAFGNVVKVPVGFKIASDSGSNVTEGVVIEDVSAGDTNSSGNQFVWIPVGKVYTDTAKTEANAKTITLGRYSWGSDGNTPTLEQPVAGKPVTSLVGIPVTNDSTTYSEPLTGTETTGPKNIVNFYYHTIENGGYYLGRYEAGQADSTVVCKKNQTPASSDEVSACKNMYSGNSFTSDVANSYAWDTAIIFIRTFGGTKGATYAQKNYSTFKGNTGANNDEILKINDMSGNCAEYNTDGTFRGGYYQFYQRTWISRRKDL